jgi:hypothetical protein
MLALERKCKVEDEENSEKESPDIHPSMAGDSDNLCDSQTLRCVIHGLVGFV